MNKLLTILFICLSFSCYPQEVKTKIDKFTRDTISETSWETMISKLHFGGSFKIRKINDRYLFRIKMSTGVNSVYGIKEGNKALILFEDGSTIEMTAIESTITCRGCAMVGFGGTKVMGTDMQYRLSGLDVFDLATKKPQSIRVYLINEYVEADFNKKQIQRLQLAAQLIRAHKL